MIRVVLVDHLALVCAGIRRLLQAAGDLDVVAEGATADDAVLLAVELRPHVLVLDSHVPELDRAIRTVKQHAGACEVVVLTNALHPAEAAQVTAAGASGYVCKDIPVPTLVTVLRAVCDGASERHSSPFDNGVFHPFPLPGARPRGPGDGDGLTVREMDILIELTKGSTDQEIADKLLVGEGTVKTHIRHILHKLGVRNRTAAAAYALRSRLIE